MTLLANIKKLEDLTEMSETSGFSWKHEASSNTGLMFSQSNHQLDLRKDYSL